MRLYSLLLLCLLAPLLTYAQTRKQLEEERTKTQRVRRRRSPGQESDERLWMEVLSPY